MVKIYAADFNMSESNPNGEFVRVSEINDMITKGILTFRWRQDERISF